MQTCAAETACLHHYMESCNYTPIWKHNIKPVYGKMQLYPHMEAQYKPVYGKMRWYPHMEAQYKTSIWKNALVPPSPILLLVLQSLCMDLQNSNGKLLNLVFLKNCSMLILKLENLIQNRRALIAV